MRRIITILNLLLIILFLLTKNTPAAGQNIEGYVKDATTGDPLFGANVVLVGTSKGATTDIDGKYVIKNVTPGSYTLKATYLGYFELRAEVSVKENETAEHNFNLEPVSIQGAEVVVTGQALGQKQAINQQLASNQILNAVSAQKIQELPDANAAESIGRLPGIAVLRSGGEGNQVIVRGLAPKYNAITIDGVRMSSSNSNDRSADLSMISSNMLDGIQVTKNVTADMDADVIGGSVNFELREAKSNQSGIPIFSFLSQGGYNNLANAYNKFNNYKHVISIENRFYNSLLGVFAQFDFERKNLTSNELGATYNHGKVQNETDYVILGLNLLDIPRDRQRMNGSLVLDYIIPDGKVKFTNFLSTGNTDVQTRQEFFDVFNTQNNFRLSYSTNKLNIISNSLDYRQQIPIFNVHANFSHTYSETKSPNAWSVNFMQRNETGLNPFITVLNPNPQEIQRGATPNLATSYIQSIQTTDSFSKERALAAVVDLETDINITSLITANIKLGGKFRHQTRLYDFNLIGQGGGSFTDQSSVSLTSLINTEFGIPPSDDPKQIPLMYFTDPSFSYGKFLNGDYQMGTPLDFGKISHLVDFVKGNAYLNVPAYAPDDFNSSSFDYSGYEDRSAFYVMSVVNIGPDITLIPGVRFQHLKTNYTATQGQVNTLAFVTYPHIDTTVAQNHDYWLPSVSVKYKPFSWFDIRLSYSNTLSYPDYNAIIPRISVNGNTIGYNNNKLEPTRSTNYDIYLSFYENSIGLFTVGGFLKKIDNLIFQNSFNVSAQEAVQYGPPSRIWKPASASSRYTITTFLNDPYRINNYGLELDWQTHFWYLPGPLSGLVFSANYTHIFSKAQYHDLQLVIVNRQSTYVDRTYTDRLIDQPDDIINLSLGFDNKGFSARISMLYQTNIFTGTSYWAQLRTNTAAYRRYDLAVKQDLPWYNIQVYGDLNNINGANDISVIQGGGGVPQSQQDYGMTADLGIRLKF